MSGQAGSDRTVDEALRELSDKYGQLFTESPARMKVPSVMSLLSSAVSPFDSLAPDFTNPYPPPPVPSLPSASVPPNSSFPFSPTPAHESRQFSNSGVSLPFQPSIFGRKALTPPSLSSFAPDSFRTWLDLFSEFLERFGLARYLLPENADLQDAGSHEVLIVFYQALKTAENSTTPGTLLTTILTYHHRIRSSPAALLSSLLHELGLSALTFMDHLEDVLEELTPLPHEALSNFLWRAQVALADYNQAAPKHGLTAYSDRRLYKRLLPFLPASIGDLLLPELRAHGDRRDFVPFPILFRILQDRLRLDATRQAAPLLLNMGERPRISTGPGTSVTPAYSAPSLTIPILAAAVTPAPAAAATPHWQRGPRPSASVTCWRCFQRGHFHNDCTAPSVAGCRACNTSEHNAANCWRRTAAANTPTTAAAGAALGPAQALPSMAAVATVSSSTPVARHGDGTGSSVNNISVSEYPDLPRLDCVNVPASTHNFSDLSPANLAPTASSVQKSLSSSDDNPLSHATSGHVAPRLVLAAHSSASRSSLTRRRWVVDSGLRLAWFHLSRPSTVSTPQSLACS